MTTFDITESVSQVHLGMQPLVTLVNDGPYSIYLGGDTTVDLLNGFELPPTGQMTWKPDVKLFACTRSITGQHNVARLRTSLAGELSLTTRAKFSKELYRQIVAAAATVFTPYLEVGHCASLILSRVLDTAPAGIPETIILSWLDENLTLVLQERYPTRLFPLAGISAPPQGIATMGVLAVIPVKAKYLTISANAYGVQSLLRVVGTDITLPAKLDGGAGAIGSTLGSFGYDGRIARFGGWNGAGTLYFPSNGNDVTIFVSNTAATPQILFLADENQNQTLQVINVAATSSTTVVVKLPINGIYRITNFGATFTGDIAVFWPEDTVTS